MPTEDDTRTLEQEVAAGQSEATPFVALGTVILVIAAVFAVVLAIVVAAYVAA